MSTFPASSEQEAREALLAFGVEDARLEPLSAGYVSSLWQVHSAHWGHLVLKRFHDKFSKAQVLAACRAQETVAQAVGISPRVLRARDGSPCVWTDRGHFGLFPFITGWHLEPPYQESWPEALALLLARVHEALATLPADPSSPGFMAFTATTPAAVEEALSRVRSAEVRDEEKIGWLERKLKLLSEVPQAQVVAFRRLGRQWIHGDVHPGNLLASDDLPGGLVLLDYDQASVFPWVYEVLRAFLQFALPESSAPRLQHLLERYVRAYARERPGCSAELETMVELYFWAYTAETRTFTDDEQQVRGVREFARKRMHLSEWLHTARPMLQRAVEEGLARGTGTGEKTG
jgi:Ser/Thr protein kinase RdoA (MazF antagonist)